MPDPMVTTVDRELIPPLLDLVNDHIEQPGADRDFWSSTRDKLKAALNKGEGEQVGEAGNPSAEAQHWLDEDVKNQAEIERLEARRDELEDALLPFVQAKPLPGNADDHYRLHVSGDALRAAKAAYEPNSGESPKEGMECWTICTRCMQVCDFEADYRGKCACGVSNAGANGPRVRVRSVQGIAVARNQAREEERRRIEEEHPGESYRQMVKRANEAEQKLREEQSLPTKVEAQRDLAHANLTEFADPAIREAVAAYSEEKLARKRAEGALAEAQGQSETLQAERDLWELRYGRIMGWVRWLREEVSKWHSRRNWQGLNRMVGVEDLFMASFEIEKEVAGDEVSAQRLAASKDQQFRALALEAAERATTSGRSKTAEDM